MIQYVDAFPDRFGVEAICRTLGATECGFLTARGYRAAKSRPASARTLRDQLLGAEISRLHAENYGVYGVRKMHALMRRQGWAIGRDQTGRIMRSVGTDTGFAGVPTVAQLLMRSSSTSDPGRGAAARSRSRRRVS